MKRLPVVIKQKLLVLTSLLLLVGLFLVSPVWAMESRGGEQVTIAQNEVIDDDLYVSGEIVTIDGTVRGDAIVAGRQITVNGTVEGDLIAAGQAIVIDGTINDDVRIAGQVLQLGANARIADDLVAAGASLESKTGSTIAGDLSFAGAQALLAGTVQQDVRGAIAGLEMRGTVGGNVNVTVGDKGDRPTVNPTFTPQSPVAIPTVPGGLTVTESARINGTLNYRSRSEARIDPSAQIAGGVNRDAIEPVSRPALVVWNTVQRWITLFLVGALLLWLVPGWTQRLVTTVQSKPLPSFGWGIVMVLIIGALTILISLVTIILTSLFGPFLWNLAPLILVVGLLINTLLVIGFLLFIGYVSPVVVSFLGGRWLLRSVQSNFTSKRIALLAIGLLIFVLLTAIPVLGGLVYLIVILLSLGALWIWGRKRWTSNQLAIDPRYRKI